MAEPARADGAVDLAHAREDAPRALEGDGAASVAAHAAHNQPPASTELLDAVMAEPARADGAAHLAHAREDAPRALERDERDGAASAIEPARAAAAHATDESATALLARAHGAPRALQHGRADGAADLARAPEAVRADGAADLALSRNEIEF